MPSRTPITWRSKPCSRSGSAQAGSRSSMRPAARTAVRARPIRMAGEAPPCASTSTTRRRAGHSGSRTPLAWLRRSACSQRGARVIQVNVWRPDQRACAARAARRGRRLVDCQGRACRDRSGLSRPRWRNLPPRLQSEAEMVLRIPDGARRSAADRRLGFHRSRRLALRTARCIPVAQPGSGFAPPRESIEIRTFVIIE